MVYFRKVLPSPLEVCKHLLLISAWAIVVGAGIVKTCKVSWRKLQHLHQEQRLKGCLSVQDVHLALLSGVYDALSWKCLSLCNVLQIVPAHTCFTLVLPRPRAFQQNSHGKITGSLHFSLALLRWRSWQFPILILGCSYSCLQTSIAGWSRVLILVSHPCEGDQRTASSKAVSRWNDKHKCQNDSSADKCASTADHVQGGHQL